MEMAAKEVSQPRYKGESYPFVVDVPSTLLCNVCLELCSDPQQAVCCGKLFCLDCIKKVKTRNNDKNCPCCRQPIKTFPDKRTEQEVGNLQIVCSNVGRGCRERPELRNVGEHKNVCPFELIPCQFSDVGCLETMLRKDSKDHNRKEIIEHLDLCRRRIAKLEKIQTAPLSEEVSCLKSPPDVKGREMQKGEIVVSCQPSRVVKIEVAYHDRMITSQTPFHWLSDLFRLDKWEFRLKILFFYLPIEQSHNVYLQIAELPPKPTVNASRVEVLGECELLPKESSKILHKFKPFQFTFTCKQGNKWTFNEYLIGTIKRADVDYELKVSPCIVYKLNIWKFAYYH